MKNARLDAGAFFRDAENLVDPAGAGISDAVIQFVLRGRRGGTLHYRISRGKATALDGQASRPDVVITTTTETWLQLVQGNISPIRTYLSGKVMVKGDIVLAQRAIKLFMGAGCLLCGDMPDGSGRIRRPDSGIDRNRDEHVPVLRKVSGK